LAALRSRFASKVSNPALGTFPSLVLWVVATNRCRVNVRDNAGQCAFVLGVKSSGDCQGTGSAVYGVTASLASDPSYCPFFVGVQFGVVGGCHIISI